MEKHIHGFIIGGSPSTGSSLLRQVLNRHSRIVCAHETHIWAKKDIVKNWASLKSKLNSSKIVKLRDAGLFPFKGINSEEIPSFSDKKFKELINFEQDIFSFFEAFMKTFYGLREGQIYGEKTPVNVVNFNEIFKHDERMVCVHTVRNPYDTIASLVARSKSVPEAVGFYLYNCSTALNSKNDRLITVRYEALVQNPKEELQDLLNVLGVDFEDKMLQASKINTGEITKIDSWKYDEAAAIGKQSVGRFEELSEEQKEDIISVGWNMKLKGVENYNSVPEVCQALNYEVKEPTQDFSREQMAKFKSFNRNLMIKNSNFIFKSPFTLK